SFLCTGFGISEGGALRPRQEIGEGRTPPRRQPQSDPLSSGTIDVYLRKVPADRGWPATPQSRMIRLRAPVYLLLMILAGCAARGSSLASVVDPGLGEIVDPAVRQGTL